MDRDPPFESEEAHQEWRDKVRAYLAKGDRSREPVFVGREELFDRVSLMAEGAKAGDTAGRTVVVTGAPGAGKSAFLAELAQRGTSRNEAVAFELRPGEMNPVALFEKLGSALRVRTHGRSETRTTLEGKAGIGPVGGKMGTSTTEIHPSDLERIRRRDTAPWDLIRERFGETLLGRPVIIMCDEAQNLPENDTTRAMLDSLHAGDTNRPALPFVPVFAGLSNTYAHLQDCGLSRITAANIRSVDALTPTESREYADGIMAHLGATRVSPSEVGKWAAWVVDNADGWPHHQRGLMDAIATEMDRQGTPVLSHLDGDRVAAEAAAARNRFYRDRRDATKHGTQIKSLHAIAKEANRHDGRGGQAMELAEAAAPHLLETPDKPHPYDLVTSAIRAGILQGARDDPNLRYVCPIPSMVRWLETLHHEIPLPPGGKPATR